MHSDTSSNWLSGRGARCWGSYLRCFALVLIAVVSFAISGVRYLTTLLLPGSVVLLTARRAWAKLFLNQEQALAKAFPAPATIERKTAFLTPEQIAAIQTQSKVKLESPIVTYYVGRQGKEVVGTALFDTRIVRTMPMTYMVVVRPDGSVGSVDVLAFNEPEDYLPRRNWFDLLLGRKVSDPVRLRRDIVNVTGATLTCQAVTDGVRQLLTIHKHL